MKTLKLHEIIEINESGRDSILISELQKYRKSLKVYYNHYFVRDPMLMVTAVFNACSYAIIVPGNEFTESVINYIGDPDCINEDNKNFAEYETICFNSIMLDNL